ncbi:ABC transporter ATP-binding protein [Paenibacillus oenotherae]|uniref:ABC transporter ATP-binding protein n=1 Tax=Paenibacillus oenotherae TaxID=1435645 RepID=A0ABS7D4P4_9BACL|nr:ABC transporter ATP-binding protein [Paenibacillus oenotherae]MBW7474907.1 ABC transporter ATP-binding protein [Paenibacillus oenotherae]
MPVPHLETKQLSVSYEGNKIIDSLNLQLPKGQISVMIGPNGCGKSTLLRSLARLLKPQEGAIVLSGRDIARMQTKEVAKQLSILPQGPVTPEGLTVFQLVKQGRYPYQSWLNQWSEEDESMVEQALAATKMTELAHRSVDSLSGGQRQRAWIAMTLAQGTDTILLDEPTTYLDIAHQIDVLDLLFELNETKKSTIVMVLHDLNMACRYAHNLIAVQNKTIVAQGRPEDIVSKDLVREVFGMECELMVDPFFGTPICVPEGKGRHAAAGSSRRLAEVERGKPDASFAV